MKISIAIVTVIVIATAGLFLYPRISIAPTPSPTASVSPENIIGGDKDAHGCLGSAGYSWCGPKNKCLRVWEEQCYTGPAQNIQYLLAEKYAKPASDITVKVTKSTTDYMRGDISFKAPGLPEPGPGGMFLAINEAGVWTLVYDGNGSVDCNMLKNNYRFPADMLVGFCD